MDITLEKVDQVRETMYQPEKWSHRTHTHSHRTQYCTGIFRVLSL